MVRPLELISIDKPFDSMMGLSALNFQERYKMREECIFTKALLL